MKTAKLLLQSFLHLLLSSYWLVVPQNPQKHRQAIIAHLIIKLQ